MINLITQNKFNNSNELIALLPLQDNKTFCGKHHNR